MCSKTSYNRDLGTTEGWGKKRVLLTHFNNLDELLALKLKKNAFQSTFSDFVKACQEAKNEGRLCKLQMLSKDDSVPELNEPDNCLTVKVLGPVTNCYSDKKVFKWFSDSKHTRNGHSVVVRLQYHKKSVLLGGDLNSAAERHLLDHHDDKQVFNVDIAKSCHHGASDFSIAFNAMCDFKMLRGRQNPAGLCN